MTEQQAPKRELIYHYCGVEAFMSIMKERTVWLVDLYQTNDTKEGREIIDVVRSVLADEKVEDRIIDQWVHNFTDTAIFRQGYGFCMSKEGDLLSQWRGYAQDGMGFSIGFDKTKLAQLTKKRHEKDFSAVLILQKVEYEIERQKEAIRQITVEIAASLKDGALLHGKGPGMLTMVDERTIKKREVAFNGLVFSNMMLAMRDRLTIKNKAFMEEKEWRLFAPLPLTEVPGKVEKDEVEKHKKKLEYFGRANTIVPYYTFKFGQEDVIKEVIRGPRNRTPDEVLKIFLESCGYENVKITRSGAPYLPR